MGRPIKRKFFGTDNVNDGLTYSDAGGEGITSLTVRGANSYSAGTTISFAASPIGGIRAAASVTFVTPAGSAPGNGNVATYSITTAGTGYTTAPAVTFNKPANVVVTGTIYGGPSTILNVSSTTGLYVGMVANVFYTGTVSGNPTRITGIFTGNSNIIMSAANAAAITSPISFGDVGRGGDILAVLASVITTANTIQANAWTSTSGMGNIADIVAQKGSRRYRVTNSTETEVVRLIKSTEVAAANTAGGPPAAGLMTITATDSSNGTYWVTKIDSRTCTVTPGGSAPGAQFGANAQPIWTSTGSAVVNTTVKLATND
jgi:hypothetical protein